MENSNEQNEPAELFIRKKLIELKTIIGAIECRMNDFEASKKTLEGAKNNSEMLNLAGTANFLGKEIVNICFKEFKHWLIKDEIEKALQAHMSAAVLLSSFCSSMSDEDASHLKHKTFTSGIAKLWDIGTYYHRQGNSYLLASSSSYDVIKHWEIAVKCYANVQKLCEIGSSLGMAMPAKYFEQAQAQIGDILTAKNRLNQSP